MPTLKLKVLPKFPSRVLGGSGITVTRANGTYTFSVDETGLTVPWTSVVTLAGVPTISLSSVHRRAFIVVDTWNDGASIASTTITLETAAAAGEGAFVTIKKQQNTPAAAHGGMVIVVPSGADFLEGKQGDIVAENRVRWEYPGEEWTWISDGVSRWHLVGSLWSKRGALFKGTHTGTSASYSVASPYAIDLVTGNGQWFQLDCSSGTPQDVPIDLPVPSASIRDGYAQTIIAVQRNDGAAFTGYVRTAGATYDGKELGYSVPLYNFLDTVWIRSDGEQYRTMAEFHAHQSEICELKLSTSATVVTNGVVAAATTIYFTHYTGMRVSLPTDEASGHYQRWYPHSFPGAAASKALGSAGTYGVAAGNSVWHDVFCWHPSGFSGPVIFLGPSYAATRGTGGGTSELILFGGIRVNKFSIAGSTSVPAQAARYIGRIQTNGAGAAIVILDEFDRAPGNQVIVPQGVPGTSFGLVFDGDLDTGFDWTAADHIQIITGGGARATINAAGMTMENGAAIIGNVITDTSMRVTRAVGSGIGGSTNDSASGSGAYVTHTGISVSVPANAITTGRVLRVRAIMRLTTGGTTSVLSYKMRLGGTSVAEITGSAPAVSITSRTIVWEFILIGLAAAGAAANTETAVSGAANGYSSAAIINNVTQPVALATNGALAIDIQTQWASAGVGTNTVTLAGLTAELVN